jgi:DNA-binding IclR family transcriptional regulator
MAKKHISSLKKGIDILRCFSAENEALTAKEISKKIGVPASTIYRYLDTLLNNGFLAKNSDSKYRLGFMLLRLGDLVSRGTDFLEIIRPFLIELSDRCEETTMLMVLSGRRALCIAKKETTRLIRLSPQVGLTLPLYAGASSKVLLALQSSSFISDYLSNTKIKKLTPFTTPSIDKLGEEIIEIQKKGYSLCDQDVSIGLTGIAAPILDAKEKVVASLVVAGPRDRILKDRVSITKILKELCTNASFDLGSRGSKH